MNLALPLVLGFAVLLCSCAENTLSIDKSLFRSEQKEIRVVTVNNQQAYLVVDLPNVKK